METKNSLSVMILDLIEFTDGMKFSEIQRALYDFSHQHEHYTKMPRGWWCTQLLGGPFYHQGLLHFFVSKQMENGREMNLVENTMAIHGR